MSTQQPKPAAKPAATEKKSGGISAGLILIVLFAIAIAIYTLVNDTKVIAWKWMTFICSTLKV